MTELTEKTTSLLPAILWGLLILLLSIIPGKDLPDTGILHFDKIAHVTVYFVWILLLIPAIRYHKALPGASRYPFWISNMIAIPYGVLIEVVQETLMQDRHFDVYDIAANTMGCIAGSCILLYIKRLKSVKTVSNNDQTRSVL